MNNTINTKLENIDTQTFFMAFQSGLTMPVKNLTIIWGKDESTLSRWAKSGQIPGAYKQSNGEWWFYPKLLTEPPQIQQPKSDWSTSPAKNASRQRRGVK
jgi:hypothetical protein